jgi:transaldolase
LGDRGSLRIKIFADGADLDGMTELARHPHIAGFTTNPTLMRQSGVTNYEAFARSVLEQIADRPISFEVLADELHEMERQAHSIASWGENVYVKVPITNTEGESTAKLTNRLSAEGIKVNVTAVMTLRQVRIAADALEGTRGGIVSVFAGRIADTGRDPVNTMAAARELIDPYPEVELLWASPREILNVVQADAVGCHIITVTHDLLKKLDILGHDLEQFSLETVSMFHDDALWAGFTL